MEWGLGHIANMKCKCTITLITLHDIKNLVAQSCPLFFFCFDTCTVHSLLLIIQPNKAHFTINIIYKLLCSYMFRHQICHPQGARSVTMPNYIYTNAVHVKINKVFKIFKLKLCSLIKWSLFGGSIYLYVCVVAVPAWYILNLHQTLWCVELCWLYLMSKHVWA